MTSTNTLSFYSPSSRIDPSFWETLYQIKLEKMKLESASLVISANLSIFQNLNAVYFMRESFDGDSSFPFDMGFPVEYRNFNTIEEFQSSDKRALINNIGASLFNKIRNSRAALQVKDLIQMSLISFGDLKACKFYYWFCFPAIVPKTPFSVATMNDRKETYLKLSEFGNFRSSFYRQCYSLLLTFSQEFLAFVVVFDENSKEVIDLKFLADIDPSNIAWTDNHALVVFDSLESSFSQNPLTFGWHTRNIIAYIYKLLKGSRDSFNIIALRSGYLMHLVNHFRIGEGFPEHLFNPSLQSTVTDHSVFVQLDISKNYFDFDEFSDCPRVVGWELNDKKLAMPKVSNLALIMDPSQLMAQAVDLNIGLMKWRLWPSLQRERLANTKCLLFGSGTLGCAVARALLGWGVRHITLIDNGKVSYSNPARQSLFEFEDCVTLQWKAEAAATRLKKIFPMIEAVGHVVNIPMPGHSVNFNLGNNSRDGNVDSTDDDSKLKSLVGQLDQWVQNHDVVFNLTDSREARWLPTLLAAAHGKLMINIALGFDSYLVMRHGHWEPLKHREPVGCYFCSDVVTASNSLKDRTLDQQCTVTRPGSSYIASGLGVELMVACIHANENDKGKLNGSSDIPHQIRGSLNHFDQKQFMGLPFERCIACSNSVLDRYRSHQWELVKEVCERPQILEEITGLNELLNDVDLDLDINIDMDDESEEIM